MVGVLRAGTDVAGYRVSSVLGSGAAGVVYLADGPDGTSCALKILQPDADRDPSYAARFRREAAYLKAVRHAHIVEVLDEGELPDGTLYLATQYVPGTNLAVLLAHEGALGLARAIALLAPIADALDSAHAHGVLHRDVKPANVLVGVDAQGRETSYLTDFGLAKRPGGDGVDLTRVGDFVGTNAYAAPEEILGAPRDQRVDGYSLACLFYEVVVGAPPFVRERDVDVLYAHVGEPRPSLHELVPELPAALDAVVARAMAIDPDERFATCAAFLAAVAGLEAAPVDGVRLVVGTGPEAGREIVAADELVLGREAEGSGRLASDLAMSRRHARIVRGRSGYVIEDLGSGNGTFVNGTRIAGPTRLEVGDQVGVGTSVLTVAAAGRPADAEPVTVSIAAPDGSRVEIRLVVDLAAGSVEIAVEGGPTARIVRDGDHWGVQR